jgi:very-short-patch-repair endonuclease
VESEKERRSKESKERCFKKICQSFRCWKGKSVKKKYSIKEQGVGCFRRQEPIGGYIVDFVCYEKRIVIELDGMKERDFRC